MYAAPMAQRRLEELIRAARKLLVMYEIGCQTYYAINNAMTKAIRWQVANQDASAGEVDDAMAELANALAGISGNEDVT